jgi:anti-anti-sigma regulatory factor/CRP-like cAMP-binding protein
VVSPVNILQISPLFFLGSTLIFIGYDLMYEWLWEVRHQVFLSEYGIVWLTFVAIHAAGIDAGIVIGILIAIVEQIVTTAQTTSVNKVAKRSRAVWSPSDSKLLHIHGYSTLGPRIVTLEVVGTVFFGSALNILTRMQEETGLSAEEKNIIGTPITPHTSSSILTLDRKTSFGQRKAAAFKRAPQFLVLDLRGVTHLDASATRGCFLQLVKMCAKRKIMVCASGVSPRIDWMFRSHGVSFAEPLESATFKAKLLSAGEKSKDPLEKILLFVTVQEALEFCETALLQRLTNSTNRSKSLSQILGPEEQSLSSILGSLLESSEDELEILDRLSDRYFDLVEFKSGEHVFHKDTYPDAFFVVLRGCVANSTSSSHVIERQKQSVLSGAGFVKPKRVGSASDLFDLAFLQAEEGTADKKVGTLWQMGGVVGYHDYLMERPRLFKALATQDGTKVAKFTHSDMNLLQTEDQSLYAIMQKVLLKASTLDLANCTCHDV